MANIAKYTNRITCGAEMNETTLPIGLGQEMQRPPTTLGVHGEAQHADSVNNKQKVTSQRARGGRSHDIQKIYKSHERSVIDNKL